MEGRAGGAGAGARRRATAGGGVLAGKTRNRESDLDLARVSHEEGARAVGNKTGGSARQGGGPNAVRGYGWRLGDEVLLRRAISSGIEGAKEGKRVVDDAHHHTKSW